MNPQANGIAVSAHGVTKHFGGANGVKALSRIDFTVQDREFVSILGPSGCGKSTLLRIIAGLIPCDEGSVAVLGATVGEPNPELGIVFQTSNLLPWRSVRDNLSLGVEIAGGEELNYQALTDMVATLGLTGFEENYPHELSGGMQQRVALGQALLRSPRVLLLDEPFGALDALTRDKLNVELLRLWQAEKKTVLLVTHSIGEAVLLSDRILVMTARPGRIQKEIVVELERPRDPAVTKKSEGFGEYVVQLGELMGVG